MSKSVWLVIALALGLGAGLAAPSARADDGFAQNVVLNGSGVTLRGERADIQTPGGTPSHFSLQSADNGEMDLVAVGANGGYLQDGYIQNNGAALYSCASNTGQLEAYVEWDVEPAGDIDCVVTDGGVGDDGPESHKFAIRRNTTGSTWWSLLYDGAQKAILDANFEPAYEMMAEGAFRPNCNPGTSLWGKFKGDTPWAWTSDLYNNSTTWNTLNDPPAWPVANTGWSVGTPPSPFDISFNGFNGC